MPADKLIDLAARLGDAEKYIADEADAPGAELFLQDLIDARGDLWSSLEA